MSAAAGLLMLLGMRCAAAVPHNQLPGLIPKQGGWRGTTLGWTHDPKNYEKKYGYPLHLYRIFPRATAPVPPAVGPAVASWVAGGGILWYNIAPENWTHAGTEEYDAALANHSAAVKALAPANVFVCVYHEADHNVDPTQGRTVEAYHRMWSHFHDRFNHAGVTNAVWVMDYSSNLVNPKPWSAAQQLWPGDDLVDWLFFNVFQHADKVKRDWTHDVKKQCEQFAAASSAGHNFTSKPWGVGAFGTQQDVPAADRQAFLNEAAAALHAGTFPLKALNYYDSRTSAIDSGLLPTYEKYLATDFYTVNDA